MKTIKIVTFCIFLVFSKTTAQDLRLGKVSIEELKEKSHPNDTSAVAAIIFEKGQNTFEYDQDRGFTMDLEVITRIKIYKKEGYDWATKKINYYTSGSSKEKVYLTDANTYN